jgi:ABC-type phosphate transport system substrate-binding protein
MRISKEKKEKISEQILSYLFSISPKSEFTIKIAQELARDEEFTKKLLIDLKNKGLITEIKKNPEGIIYLKRSRWKISDKAYLQYKKLMSLN